jgi:hypothetical protein
MATPPKPKHGKRGAMPPRVKQQPSRVKGPSRRIPDGGTSKEPKEREEIEEPECED